MQKRGRQQNKIKPIRVDHEMSNFDEMWKLRYVDCEMRCVEYFARIRLMVKRGISMNEVD